MDLADDVSVCFNKQGKYRVHLTAREEGTGQLLLCMEIDFSVSLYKVSQSALDTILMPRKTIVT